MSKNNKKSIVSQLRDVNHRIQTLSERSYNPDLGHSEAKELNRRKKKLVKTREKLEKKLDKSSIE
tara:strand:- start:85 stop:279 length:195 start_codon:yes stop_codon:yes gene_type:complete